MEKGSQSIQGLNNYGNNCFLNAIMQVLLSCPLLKKHKFINFFKEVTKANFKNSLIFWFSVLVLIFDNKYKSLSLEHAHQQFISVFRNYIPSFHCDQQIDAVVFVEDLIMLLAIEKCPAGVKNLLDKTMFSIHLADSIECLECGNVISIEDEILALSNDFENLVEDDNSFCQSCSKETPHIKRTEISSAGEIMIMLKRDFDKETKNSFNIKNFDYILFGNILFNQNHAHYIAEVEKNGQKFLITDEEILERIPKGFEDSILFYVKTSSLKDYL